MLVELHTLYSLELTACGKKEVLVTGTWCIGLCDTWTSRALDLGGLEVAVSLGLGVGV